MTVSREPAPGNPQGAPLPAILVAGGTDGSGGSGLDADARAVAAAGGRAVPVVLAVTAQAPDRVLAWHTVPGETVEHQVAAAEAFRVSAWKIGMLASPDAFRALVPGLHAFRELGRGPIVWDPVLRASAGDPLWRGPEGFLEEEVLPRVTWVTPNVPEAEALTGRTIRDVGDAVRAAELLRTRGVRHVVVKGGHLEGEPCDVLVDDDGVRRFDGRRIVGRRVRGTGCAFASVLATSLALGATAREAVDRAKRFVERGIRRAEPLPGDVEACRPAPAERRSPAGTASGAPRTRGEERWP